MKSSFKKNFIWLLFFQFFLIYYSTFSFAKDIYIIYHNTNSDIDRATDISIVNNDEKALNIQIYEPKSDTVDETNVINKKISICDVKKIIKRGEPSNLIQSCAGIPFLGLTCIAIDYISEKDITSQYINNETKQKCTCKNFNVKLQSSEIPDWIQGLSKSKLVFQVNKDIFSTFEMINKFFSQEKIFTKTLLIEKNRIKIATPFIIESCSEKIIFKNKYLIDIKPSQTPNCTELDLFSETYQSGLYENDWIRADYFNSDEFIYLSKLTKEISLHECNK